MAFVGRKDQNRKGIRPFNFWVAFWLCIGFSCLLEAPNLCMRRGESIFVRYRSNWDKERIFHFDFGTEHIFSFFLLPFDKKGIFKNMVMHINTASFPEQIKYPKVFFMRRVQRAILNLWAFYSRLLPFIPSLTWLTFVTGSHIFVCA